MEYRKAHVSALFYSLMISPPVYNFDCRVYVDNTETIISSSDMEDLLRNVQISVFQTQMNSFSWILFLSHNIIKPDFFL